MAWLGWIPPVTYVRPGENFRLHLVQFLLPALAVGYRSSALIMRITRSALLEVMREDYIRTAWAKGQNGRVVIWHHALKNAMLPVITVIGIEFAFLIGGPRGDRDRVQPAGAWRASSSRPFSGATTPSCRTLVMFIAIIVILSNLLVDILYGVLDPRVRVCRLARPRPSCRSRPRRPRRGRRLVDRARPLRRRKPLGAAGGAVMLAILLTAVFADQLQTHDPIATDAAATLAPPSRAHWFGTDHLGRDIYSRIVHGARVSLAVGVASTLFGSVLGGIIGLLSGYAGGKTDLIAQRLLDILQGLPLLVLALVMSAALGPSIENVIIAISIPIIPRAARVIRASVLAIRELQYVEAARAVGVQTPAHRLPAHPAQHGGAVHRALHGAARQRHPGRGDAVLPRPRRARAVPLVGAHAVGVGRGIRAEGAAPRALPGRRHQPRRLRLQPARRRPARRARPAPARGLERAEKGPSAAVRRPRPHGSTYRKYASPCGHRAPPRSWTLLRL